MESTHSWGDPEFLGRLIGCTPQVVAGVSGAFRRSYVARTVMVKNKMKPEK